MSPRLVFRKVECQTGPGGLRVWAEDGPRGEEGFLQMSPRLPNSEPQMGKEWPMKEFFSLTLSLKG